MIRFHCITTICISALILVTIDPLLAQQVVRTSDGVFTTRENPSALPLPTNDDAFQFVIYGDRTGGDRSGLNVLKQAVTDTNLLDPDFVLTVGDLIQGYNRPDEWLEEAAEFKDIMSKLNMPWFPVAGNHDIYWDFNDPERPAFHHEKNYESKFGPLWYSFAHKNSGFIVLYTDEGDPESGEKAFNQGRLQNMSETQLEFLRQALGKYKDLPNVFVAMHHPRWVGGGYSGSNWPEIHQMLVGAGNVKAVFAGHIHKMRFDPEDGIEYFALATTGGALGADLPEAGYLHHYNVVTVRPGGHTVATFPVGAVIDPKKFAPEFLADVRAVQGMRPKQTGKRLAVSQDGMVGQQYSISIPNPGKFPIEVEVTPKMNSGWRCAPDHQHLVIAPGKTAGMDFYFYRGAETTNEKDPWKHFNAPGLEMSVDYLHESARIRIPARKIAINTVLQPPAPESFSVDHAMCLHLRGKQSPGSRRELNDIRSDCARVKSAELNLEQGPFTLEAWVYPRELDGSRAIVAKTQSSEFALFLRSGKPLFDVHLNGKYVTAVSDSKVPLNEWSHVAGVFDGQHVRLYVNGDQVAQVKGAGQRTLNRLPMYVGADPDRAGNPTRQFAGKIDEVRLSEGSRYDQDFEPALRFQRDSETLILLHLDREVGPFLLNDSSRDAVVERLGGAAVLER